LTADRREQSQRTEENERNIRKSENQKVMRKKNMNLKNIGTKAVIAIAFLLALATPQNLLAHALPAGCSDSAANVSIGISRRMG
jgi:hypothetical protein